MYGKNHYNIVISLQLIKINGKKKKRMEFRGRNFLTQENCLLTVPLPSLSHYLMQRKYPGLQNFFFPLSIGSIGSNALPHPLLLIRCPKKGLDICHLQRFTSVMPILPLVEMNECFSIILQGQSWLPLQLIFPLAERPRGIADATVLSGASAPR